MIKVKVTIGWQDLEKSKSTHTNGLSIYNFTNTDENIFNNKKFFINQHVENPDYWFILENTISNSVEHSNINPDNIFFLNSETRYSPSFFMRKSKIEFLKQFNEIYSPNFINMDNAINQPPFLSWKLRGDPFKDFYETSDIEFYKNYQPKKKKLLSVYCTNKKITEIQKVRFDFVNKLKILLGDDMDWFGHDTKTKTKLEGISHYKYHLVLENQIGHNFISEKLFDSFLGGAFPIYSGAPNLNDYFPKNSFLNINLNDFAGSIKKINNLIESDAYEENLDNIYNSKLIALEEFNLIKRIDKIVDKKIEDNLTGDKIEKYFIYPKIKYEGKSSISKLMYSLNQRLKILSDKLESFYD